MNNIYQHPFPPFTNQIDDYVPNERNVQQIFQQFLLPPAAVLLVSFIWLSYKKFSLTKRLIISWFLLCSLCHCVLELYFVLNYKKIVSDSNLLGEIWKEYAKSDGRYVIGEEGTVAIEMLTAFIVGPICLLTYIAIIINNKYRHILQILSSTCQLYGVLIFFLSEYLFGWIHTRYLDAYYFYFYFFFFNVVWVFVPFYIIVRSSLIIIRQQHDVDLLRIKKKMK